MKKKSEKTEKQIRKSKAEMNLTFKEKQEMREKMITNLRKKDKTLLKLDLKKTSKKTVPLLPKNIQKWEKTEGKGIDIVGYDTENAPIGMAILDEEDPKRFLREEKTLQNYSFRHPGFRPALVKIAAKTAEGKPVTIYRKVGIREKATKAQEEEIIQQTVNNLTKPGNYWALSEEGAKYASETMGGHYTKPSITFEAEVKPGVIDPHKTIGRSITEYKKDQEVIFAEKNPKIFLKNVKVVSGYPEEKVLTEKAINTEVEIKNPWREAEMQDFEENYDFLQKEISNRKIQETPY